MTRSRRRTRSRCSSRTFAASSRRAASRGCSTQSGEPVTSSEPEAGDGVALSPQAGAETSRPVPHGRRRTPLSHLPIRVRLATGVALVAFAILAIFAVAVGTLTVHRLRSTFNDQLQTQGQYVASAFEHDIRFVDRGLSIPNFSTIVGYDGGTARVLSFTGGVMYPAGAQPLGPLLPGLHQSGAYMVENFEAYFGVDGALSYYVQFGLPVAP